MKRDERPQVTVRDTGRVITAYATECTCCVQFKPMAVVLGDSGAVRYICKDCHSMWMGDLYLFKMEDVRWV